MIELCRRLGHEAFGEEDDEASDLVLTDCPMFGSILRIFQMGNSNSMIAKIYSFHGRGNYIKFCVLGFKHMSLLQLLNLYLFVFGFRLSTATLSGVEYHFIMQRYYWIIGQTFITGSI